MKVLLFLNLFFNLITVINPIIFLENCHCVHHGCPCGFLTDPRKPCRCNPNKIASYMGKISGPLLDRIDIHIEVPAIRYKEFSDTKDAEPSNVIKARVERARTIQRERFKEDKIFSNARMNTKLIKKILRIRK